MSSWTYTWYAWYPVRLATMNGMYWEYTGRWAWLKTVRVVETLWGDCFYEEQRP